MESKHHTFPAGKPDHPQVLAWPPLLFAAVIAAGWIAHRCDPIVLSAYLPARGLAIAVALAAVLLASWAGVAMRSAGTAIHPSHPTTAIVAGGPYRFTRNPMYLSLCLLALAPGLWSGGVWLLVAAPVLGCVLHWGVIRREEAYLSEKFGDAYRDYQASVRRWI